MRQTKKSSTGVKLPFIIAQMPSYLRVRSRAAVRSFRADTDRPNRFLRDPGHSDMRSGCRALIAMIGLIALEMIRTNRSIGLNILVGAVCLLYE